MASKLIETPQLVPIEISNEKKRVTILSNVIKMLTNRKLLAENDLDKNIKKIVETQTDDYTYKINLDTKVESPENKVFIVKVISQKITAINKSSGISDFLHTYKNFSKIIIVNLINNKTRQHIEANYPHTKIFLEKQLLMDIVAHDVVPLHAIMNPEDTEAFLKENFVRKKDMPKIYTTDPIAQYYDMKQGQICRIVRPSETSGLVAFYRVVVKGTYK
jgi:DNA-directed RNA polymerase I, II, and III subunit RPABC1